MTFVYLFDTLALIIIHNRIVSTKSKTLALYASSGQTIKLVAVKAVGHVTGSKQLKSYGRLSHGSAASAVYY